MNSIALSWWKAILISQTFFLVLDVEKLEGPLNQAMDYS